MPGFNYRMTEFQAALGLTQMKKLDRIITARRRHAASYGVLLSGTLLQAPIVNDNGTSIYQSYVVLLPKQRTTHRQSLIRQLKERGIETTIGTWHMPITTYFRQRYGYNTGDFPVTDCVFARAMTLPLYEELSIRDQQHICDLVCDVLEELVA
jgi:dTDP-4-amino-4,6-dideoxygalactose transaminase